MAQYIQVNVSEINHMDKANLFTAMGTSLMEYFIWDNHIMDPCSIKVEANM
jgi:hypothetical protein